MNNITSSSNNQEHQDEDMNATRAFLASRASLALNNMGVSLLERGCIREAINTFTDAIGFMKRSMEESNHDDASISSDDVEKSLHKAATLLVQLHPGTTTTPQGHPQTFVHPLDDQDVELSDAAFNHGPSSPLSFPIRLRSQNTPTPSGGSTTTTFLEIPAAIILYNLGLANLLLAASATACSSSSEEGKFGDQHNKYKTRMLSCAFKSLSLSQCILMQQVDKKKRFPCSNRNDDDDVYHELLRLKQLSALVLTCLFRVFHATSQTHQADRVLATLTRMVHEGRESESILQSLNVETGASGRTMAPAA